MANGYLQFIRSRGIVGFGIGFIMGKAVSDLVGAFVNDFINPLVGLLVGGLKNLNELTVHIFSAQIKYGDFINVVINFLVLTIITYLLFKGLRLERLDEQKK